MSLSDRWRNIRPEALYHPRTAGRLIRMVGLTLEAVGLDVRVGDRCRVERQQGGDIEAEVVGFDDLGMEAIYEFEVEDMPVTVAVDTKGESVHKTGPQTWYAKINATEV